MVVLKVFGKGCPKCQALTERTHEAARALGLDYDLQKETDLEQIIAAGVLTTPALSVDGRLAVAGHVPTVARLRELLGMAAA